MDNEIIIMIRDCMYRESKMTVWEQNFINSIIDNDELSDRQISILNKIWDKVTG